MKNFTLINLFILILFVGFGKAQTDGKSEWVNLESDNKDFSISMPDGFQVFSDKEGYSFTTMEAIKKGNFKNNIKVNNIRYITAARDGGTFFVISYQTNNLEKSFPSISNAHPKADLVSKYTKYGVEVKNVISSNDKFYSHQIFLGYKDRIYHIFGGAKNENNQSLQRFLSSLKINNENLFSPDENKIGKNFSISAMQDTPFIIEKEKKKDSQDSSDKASKDKADLTPLNLIYTTKPRLTEKARKKNTAGTVSLRVTFSSNAIMEKISVIEDLPDGLTESAILAARLIRFLPAEKENVAIDTTKQLNFNFSIY